MHDIGTENAVLGCIIKYGADALDEVLDLCNADMFTDLTNASTFVAIKHLYDAGVKVFDTPTILSAAKDKKVVSYIKKDVLEELTGVACHMSNLPKLTAKIRKLQIYRLWRFQFEKKASDLEKFTGEESIAQFLALSEFNIDQLLNNETEPVQMGDGLRKQLEELASNPVTQMGISTGFPVYDAAIGGGLRDGSVNIIGARTKVGKSQYLNNAALNMAREGIKILYVDTEMTVKEQQHRAVARLADVDVNDIETGRFGKNHHATMKVLDASDFMSKLPYEHVNVSGMPFEDQVAIIVKWIRKNKKINPDGTVDKVVIIYDYLKMSTQSDINGNLAEYQILGFMMTTLHNLSVRHSFPILTAIQLNRDGISKEDTSSASGSDRIIWLCSNFAILKYKSEEEIAADGIEAGNRKLVVLVARHGPGLSEGDYVNYIIDGYKSKVIEKKRRSTISEEKRISKTGNP